MAYKRSPFPMVKGTKGHSSALKQVEKHGRWLLDTSTKEGEAISKQIKGIKTVSSRGGAPINKIGTLIPDKPSLVQDIKFGARQGYGLDKNLRMGKGFSKATRVASRGGQIAKTIVKGASKALTAVAVPLTLYDMYKSGQKHSGGKAVKGQKSFIKEAKGKTKSIFKKK